MDRVLYTWTIYKGGKNLPREMYVARKWKIELGKVELASNEPPLISYDLETIRSELRRMGFLSIGKMYQDDETIIESWL